MIDYQPNRPLDNRQLNELFAASWPGDRDRDFQQVLARSLVYVAAMEADRLVGFVNVAWDGGQHAFLLDTTVHPDFQWHGIGTLLVKEAAELARQAGVVWLHVDFEEALARFYLEACGFATTAAGLMNLDA